MYEALFQFLAILTVSLATFFVLRRESTLSSLRLFQGFWAALLLLYVTANPLGFMSPPPDEALYIQSISGNLIANAASVKTFTTILRPIYHVFFSSNTAFILLQISALVISLQLIHEKFSKLGHPNQRPPILQIIFACLLMNIGWKYFVFITRESLVFSISTLGFLLLTRQRGIMPYFYGAACLFLLLFLRPINIMMVIGFSGLYNYLDNRDRKLLVLMCFLFIGFMCLLFLYSNLTIYVDAMRLERTDQDGFYQMPVLFSENPLLYLALLLSQQLFSFWPILVASTPFTNISECMIFLSSLLICLGFSGRSGNAGWTFLAFSLPLMVYSIVEYHVHSIPRHRFYFYIMLLYFTLHYYQRATPSTIRPPTDQRKTKNDYSIESTSHFDHNGASR